MALKNHFTTKSYDYFKYNKKVKTSKDKFLQRKDRVMYERLCRKLDEIDMENFLISNFIKGKKWIGEFLEDDSLEIYQEYKKRNQAITHFFQEEIENLVNDEEDPRNVFKSEQNEYPKIISSVMANEISLETFIILDRFLGLSEKYDKYYGDDLIWNRIKFLSSKASPFVTYDKKKIKSILKDIFF